MIVSQGSEKNEFIQGIPFSLIRFLVYFYWMHYFGGVCQVSRRGSLSYADSGKWKEIY